MTKTLTKAEIAEKIFQVVGLSKTDSLQVVNQLMDVVSTALSQGKSIKISRFGTFQVRSKTERVGRNPKTGEEVTISPRRVISFKSSQNLKDAINKE